MLRMVRKLARIAATAALIVLVTGAAADGQDAPLMLVRVDPSSKIRLLSNNNPVFPDVVWPSGNFSFADARDSLKVETHSGAASGTFSLVAHVNEMRWLTTVWALEIYVRGTPGTAFHLSWSCSDASTASVTSAGFFSVGAGVSGGDCAKTGGEDASVRVLSYTGPLAQAGSASYSNAIDGVTSGKIAFDPGSPGVTYSLAMSFGQWLDLQNVSVGGSLNNGIPFVGSSSMTTNINFAVNLIRPHQQTPVSRIVAPPSSAVGASVMLDGTTSSDPDGSIVEYTWEIQNSSGGTDVFRGAAYGKLSYTWPKPGNYTAKLTVTDTDGLTGTSSTSVSVTAVLDTDHDGVPDSGDSCPGTAAGAAVDANGCSAAQHDSDGDGVLDSADLCPATIPGAPVDAYGCSMAQRQLTLSIVPGGDNQTGSVSQVLPQSLVVQIADQFGHSAANVPILFSITQQPDNAKATLSDPTGITLSDGTFATQFTLGVAPGQYQITASCGSGQTCTPNSVVFTESATQCGDSRDTLIQNYVKFGNVAAGKSKISGAVYLFDPAPTCDMFTEGHPDFDVNNDTSWALVREPLIPAFSDWVANYRAALSIKSGYRSPEHNASPSVGGAKGSRHVFGDAIDVANLAKSLASWKEIYDAAQAAGADWLEKSDSIYPCRCTTEKCTCVHADWRYTLGYYAK